MSGTIGVLFAVVQICLKRAANQKLRHALGDGQDAYDVKVVRPVAKEIARRLKVTGFMNYTTNTEMAHYKAAVRTLLTELDHRGVDLRFTDMSEIRRDGLINEIAVQTRLRLAPGGRCTSFMKFFKAETTPEAIRQVAAEIADNVVKALSGRNVSLLKPQEQKLVAESSIAPPRDSNSIAFPELELQRLDQEGEMIQEADSKEDVVLMNDEALSSSAASIKESQGEDQPLAPSQAPDSLELSNLSLSTQGKIHSPSLPSITQLPMTPTAPQPDLQTKKEKEEESSASPSTKQVSTSAPWILDSLSVPSSQSLITWPVNRPENRTEEEKESSGQITGLCQHASIVA